MQELSVAFWLLITPALTLGVALTLGWAYWLARRGAPWLPTSPAAAQRMLELAEVKPGQQVVDLGAGDGRLVIMAARRFGARAAGVEIDPALCFIANGLIALFGLRGRARVYRGDMYGFDLKQADVVTLCLLRTTNERLQARLSQQLRPGARVVSRLFVMPGWTPVAFDADRLIYVYEMGPAGEVTTDDEKTLKA